MARTVSLAMYAAPSGALAAFWRVLRLRLVGAGFRDVEEDLADPSDLAAHWLSPDLLLGQACGFPLVCALKNRVRLVGTPCYAADGCCGADYCSLIVVRSDDPARSLAGLRGRRAAFNARDSQSGYNALRALAAPLALQGRFFGAIVETGAHRRSLAAVQNNEADVAAVDCVTFALAAQESRNAVRGLRILARSPSVPGLPLITAAGTSDEELERLRAVLAQTCSDPALGEARRLMRLAGFAVLPLERYGAIARLEADAVSLGYPVLA